MFGDEYKFFQSPIPDFCNSPLISSIQQCLAKFFVLSSWDTKPIFTTVQTTLLLLIVKFSSRLNRASDLHSKDAWF